MHVADLQSPADGRVLKISDMRGKGCAQQAAWESCLLDKLPPSQCLNLPLNTWAAWTCPKELGIPGISEEDEGCYRPMIFQELQYVKGDTLGRKCQKVSINGDEDCDLSLYMYTRSLSQYQILGIRKAFFRLSILHINMLNLSSYLFLSSASPVATSWTRSPPP